MAPVQQALASAQLALILRVRRQCEPEVDLFPERHTNLPLIPLDDRLARISHQPSARTALHHHTLDRVQALPGVFFPSVNSPGTHPDQFSESSTSRPTRVGRSRGGEVSS